LLSGFDSVFLSFSAIMKQFYNDITTDLVSIFNSSHYEIDSYVVTIEDLRL